MKFIDIANFMLAGPQAIYAVIAIWLFMRPSTSTEQEHKSSNKRLAFAIGIAVVGLLMTLSFAAWILRHPIKPEIVFVDKPVPCPPPLPATRTGPASSKGPCSFANSGSIGSTNSNCSPTKDKKGGGA